ncbi:MAG: molybdopterin-binding protein [Candidatus Thiodiazotropha sp.]
MSQSFGLIIIGDEILFGDREERHLPYFRQLLGHRGLQLHRCWFLPDEKIPLIKHFTFSMAEADPVFVCGGIGATPDDLTRACAAQAAGVALESHPEAVALIEKRYGDEAYPTRIRMAELPRGAELIPNPYNQIPGFSINQHYFLPGFPQMAWPMAEWVLDHLYPSSMDQFSVLSLQVVDTPESTLVAIMEQVNERFPKLKTFSLPTLGANGYIELGIRGRGDILPAFLELKQALQAQQIPFR